MLKYAITVLIHQKQYKYSFQTKTKLLLERGMRDLPNLWLHQVDNQKLCELIWRSEDRISIYTKSFPHGITLEMDLQKTILFLINEP